MTNRVVHQCRDPQGREVVGWTIFCPGCNDIHQFDKTWTFDGDLDRPTLSPSLLVRSGHYVPGHPGGSCWCTYNAGRPDEPPPFTCYLCHSFIRAGQIEFLSDCSHGLAGKTIPLEAW